MVFYKKNLTFIVIIILIFTKSVYSYSLYNCANNYIYCQSYYTSQLTGDILQLVIPFTAFAYSTFITDYEGIQQLTYGYGATLLATYIIKISANKTRPNKGSHSFPSGHTSSAFSGASYLQIRYGWKFGLPAYILASYVGLSRIEAKRHFPSDVIGGSLLAIGFSYLFTNEYLTKKNIIIIPECSDNNIKLSLIFILH